MFMIFLGHKTFMERPILIGFFLYICINILIMLVFWQFLYENGRLFL